jgi:hypothetical protein
MNEKTPANQTTLAVQAAGRLLEIAAWTTLGLVVVGFAASLPGIEEAFDNSPPWSMLWVVSRGVGLVTALTLLTLWGASLFHASLSTPWRHRVPRPVVIALLLIGNALGGLLYYVLALHWTVRKEFHS